MSRVPRLLSGHNLKSIPLSPAEQYLVSMIDGVLGEQELALVAGLSPAQAAATLDRLVKAGAIALDAGAPEPPPPPPPRPPMATLPEGGVASLRYDPALLEEQVDLEPEKKRRVLDLFYRLDDLTYYKLLGIEPQAEKKQIKNAYYATAPEFHPDKYFRKNLGSYKQKIEAIFARITLAHDTLTSAERRAEYDEYLEQTKQNRAMSAVFEQTAADMAAAEAAVQKAAAAAITAQPAPRPEPVARPSAPAMPAVSQEEILRQRREALARKLTGGRPAPTRRPGSESVTRMPAVAPPQPPISQAAPPSDPEAMERAAESLRMRHEAAVTEAKRQQLQRHLDSGRAALDRQDWAAAANSFRIASSLEPEDPRVQNACNEGLRVVAAALADGYWKQAVYEEGQERWAEAALSYAKVCQGKPDNAVAHERVAYTTIRSSGNVRRAVEFARKAVEIAPKQPEFHVTLARAYLAAGLEKSVHGELDRALQLAPKDPKIQQLVAHVRAQATKDGKVS
jgi:curved DNA-binding protein CbpA